MDEKEQLSRIGFSVRKLLVECADEHDVDRMRYMVNSAINEAIHEWKEVRDRAEMWWLANQPWKPK